MENDSSDASEPEQQPIVNLVVHPCGAVTKEISADYLQYIKDTPDDYCTCIMLEVEGHVAIVWCNEEGIPKRLPMNMGIQAVLSPSSPLFGTCVITGPGDEDGNMLSVPDAVLKLFF